jgi:hypothetical protein
MMHAVMISFVVKLVPVFCLYSPSTTLCRVLLNEDLRKVDQQQLIM